MIKQNEKTGDKEAVVFKQKHKKRDYHSVNTKNNDFYTCPKCGDGLRREFFSDVTIWRCYSCNRVYDRSMLNGIDKIGSEKKND